MRRTFLISDSIVSPLGIGSRENYDAVRSGRSAVRRHCGVFGVPEPFAASLFDREAVLNRALARGIPAGLPFFDTLCLLSATLALEGSGVDPRSPRTAFLLSTAKGNIEALGKDGDAEVLLGRSAERIRSHFGNPNPATVVSNACISGAAALVQASRMIADGSFDHVVVVGAELQSRFIISGFLCLKALSDEPCRPFDAQRRGLNAGEAAATIILGCDAPAPAWEIASGAIRNDANHISGPSRTGEGSYNCLRHVLEGADRSELAFVNVHGTATAYNDEMESIALERAGLSDIPVNALKGVFGHTMGAAGLLEAIVSMRACEDGLVLPTLGFSTPGTSRSVGVSAEQRPVHGNSFIKLLSGFGGCNAALLFRRCNAGEMSCALPGREDPLPQYEVTGSAHLDSVTLGGAEGLASLYREGGYAYPKFFKMDALSKLGFLAVERLLEGEPLPEEPREDVAVVLFTSSGSLCNDKNFEKTASVGDWFPSPALFVYTLPNIVTGEISIRRRIKGESSCHVLAGRDDAVMGRIVREAFLDSTTREIVCGWIDCHTPDDFEADLKLIRRKQ